jgi:hypothetical protein
MIDRQAAHESMVRRVEQAQKAIDPLKAGRSRQAGMARALGAVLDELHGRMDLAWMVLNEQPFGGVERATFRGQKAAELGICYTAIQGAYDELAQLGIISKDERTEPTTIELVKALKEQERVEPRRRR